MNSLAALRRRIGLPETTVCRKLDRDPGRSWAEGKQFPVIHELARPLYESGFEHRPFYDEEI